MNTPITRETWDALFDSGEERVPALVEAILTQARVYGASDVHLDPKPNGMRVRMRIDGVLQDECHIPEHLMNNVVARLKIIAGLLTHHHDLPQEGSTADRDGGGEVRVSTFPTIDGERVVLRMMGSDQPSSVADLRLPENIARELTDAIAATDGLMLAVGPSGAGKTTTLYAALEETAAIAKGGRSIFTVEDPVERRLPDAVQTLVDPDHGRTFARSLRSAMRQNPDVLMVGEIRDADTANVAVEAGFTGHLVWSTMHAAGAADVPLRLMEMGIEDYVIASTLRLVIAQRLLRRLCSSCRERDDDGHWKAVGCEQCGGLGFHGRIAIAESLPSGPELASALKQRVSRDEIHALVTAHGPDLHQQGRHALDNGATSRAELARCLPGSI